MLSILKKCRIRIFNRGLGSGCRHLLWCVKPLLWVLASSPVKWRAWQYLPLKVMTIKWDYARKHSAEGSTQKSMNGSWKQTQKTSSSLQFIFLSAETMVFSSSAIIPTNMVSGAHSFSQHFLSTNYKPRIVLKMQRWTNSFPSNSSSSGREDS